MSSPETGFAEVPWDLYSANGGELDGLPPEGPRHDDVTCRAEWIGPTDMPNESPWLCCLPEGHGGTHRGGDSVSTLAEWAKEQAAYPSLASTDPQSSEVDRG